MYRRAVAGWPRHYIRSIWQLRWKAGVDPRPGDYACNLRAKPAASAHFGTKVAAAGGFRIVLRTQDDAQRDRFTENRIERYSLTAGIVGRWDRDARRAHLETARNAVDRYLAAGAGDQPGLYNLTPRFQAARVYSALGRKDEAREFSVGVLEGATRHSRMRHCHFGMEQEGLLPPRIAERIAAALNGESRGRR